MKIHGDVISPYTRMCLVTAHELGLVDKVSLASAHVKPTEVNAELSRLSPIGKIPVLETRFMTAGSSWNISPIMPVPGISFRMMA
jgi:glutathione S-transferase